MKKAKLSLLGLFILFCSCIYAQNGGQYQENSSTRIEQNGYTSSGQAIIIVTNKQDCMANMRIDYGNTSSVKSVAPLSSDTFHITIPQNGKVRAKTETNCGMPDFGQVEITVVEIVPIRYKDFSVKYLGDNTLLVKFTPLEITNVRQINLLVSEDSKVYRRIAVILPKDLVPDKLYSITVKYNLASKD